MFIIDFIAFLFVLGIVVFVHELGHFVAAKTSGVRVEEFGIGFPPRLYKKTIGETQYFIGGTPFGGMTRVYGMDEMDEEKDKDSKSYESKSALKKIWICSGGIIFNFIFAVLVFYALVSFSGFKTEQPLVFDYHFPFGSQVNNVLIGRIEKGSPAEAAGLKFRDVVLSVNGIEVKTMEEFQKIILDNKGKEVVLKMKDGRDVKITPRSEYTAIQGPLGVALGEMATISYTTLPEKVFSGFLHTYNITDYSLRAMGWLISYSVTNKSLGTIVSSLAGPAGVPWATCLSFQERSAFFEGMSSSMSAVTNVIPSARIWNW